MGGEINTYMPYYVIERTTQALDEVGKNLKDSKILILGVAYKKNVDDLRESPSLKLMDILLKKGVQVDYCDPLIPKLLETREYNFYKNSVDLTQENLKKYDCVIISTDHDLFDKEIILKNAKLIIDTRNMFKGVRQTKIYKA